MVRVLKGGVRPKEMVKIRTLTPQSHPKVRTLKPSEHNPAILDSAAVRVAGKTVSFDQNFYNEALKGKGINIAEALSKLEYLQRFLTPLSSKSLDMCLKLSEKLSNLESLDVKVFQSFINRVQKRTIFGSIESNIIALENEREVIKRNVNAIKEIQTLIRKLELEYNLVKVLFPVILSKETGDIRNMVEMDKGNLAALELSISEYKVKTHMANVENITAGSTIDKAKALLKVYMDGGEKDVSLKDQIIGLVKSNIKV